MKKYNIELDEMVADYLENLSKRTNIGVDTLISDAIFNIVNELETKELNIFRVDRNNL